MWPLKVAEIPSSRASRMDGIANSYKRTWLGLPRCFSDISLFNKNILQLPLKSISLGYKQEKTCLLLELTESRDATVKGAGATIHTGRKWRAQEEVGKAGCNIRRFWKNSSQPGRVGLRRAGAVLV